MVGGGGTSCFSALLRIWADFHCHPETKDF